jgi:hypothetical protein
MRLTKAQLSLLAQYCSDLSKILFGSTVIGYFIPNGEGLVTWPVFLAGALVALVCLFIGVNLARDPSSL